MRNPFRSETAAFHFLLLTLGAFAAIALVEFAAGATAGFVAWLLASAGAVIVYARRAPRAAVTPTAPQHVGSSDERRLVLVAETASVPADVLDDVRGSADEVLVVVPSAPSRLHAWTGDVDADRGRARASADALAERLRSRGVAASGAVGDEDRLQAVDDALRTFGADEVVVATPLAEPDAATVARLSERYTLPIRHVLV